MSRFHASIRELLEDIHTFLYGTLQNEQLSSASLTQKEKLLSLMKKFSNDYPELLLEIESEEKVQSCKRRSASSPLPYVDMKGGNFKMSYLASDKDNYDACVEKCDSLENQSYTGSEDCGSDDAKFLPEVSASDLYACEKSGYLDKKKRESIKGWLNPFQRRWCAIKDGILYYFEKPSDRKQKGSIILNGYEARSLPYDQREGKKYNHCFEIVCPGKRTYQFSAASDTDLLQWIKTIDKNSNASYHGGRLSQSFSNNPQSAEQLDSLVATEDIYEVVEEDARSLGTKADENIENETETKEITVSQDLPNQDQIMDLSEWYVGLWDCSGTDESELTFYRGDMIHVISKEYDSFSWWIGEKQGRIGLVPKSYLMEAYESA